MNIAEIRKNAEQKMHKTDRGPQTTLAKVSPVGHTRNSLHVMVDYYRQSDADTAACQCRSTRCTNVGGYALGQEGVGGRSRRQSAISDLGLNPVSQGKIVRYPCRAHRAAAARNSSRWSSPKARMPRLHSNQRRDANNALKDLLKAKAVSGGEERRAQDDVQKLTDRFIVEVDKVLAAKEAASVVCLASAPQESHEWPLSPLLHRHTRLCCRSTSRSSWTATAMARRVFCRGLPDINAASRLFEKSRARALNGELPS